MTRSSDSRTRADLSRNFNEEPENFAARVRSLQQNVTFADHQRNTPIFFDRMFDLRSNGTVKSIGLVLWALPLLCFAASTCVTVVFNGSHGLALAIGVLVACPALAASAAAIWTACFRRPRTPRSDLRHGNH